MFIKLLRDIKKKYGLALVGEDLDNLHVDLPQKDAYKDVYVIECFFR